MDVSLADTLAVRLEIAAHKASVLLLTNAMIVRSFLKVRKRKISRAPTVADSVNFCARRIPRLGWCQRQELNLRPKAYESSALPLSYSGLRTTLRGA
ncbi:MAG: hypothetical protein JWM04_2245 [Verrucomicrobiales bacterium]|nr:hypothetical protein [Verrucomicrobiales bacterium]